MYLHKFEYIRDMTDNMKLVCKYSYDEKISQLIYTYCNGTHYYLRISPVSNEIALMRFYDDDENVDIPIPNGFSLKSGNDLIASWDDVYYVPWYANFELYYNNSVVLKLRNERRHYVYVNTK